MVTPQRSPLNPYRKIRCREGSRVSPALEAGHYAQESSPSQSPHDFLVGVLALFGYAFLFVVALVGWVWLLRSGTEAMAIANRLLARKSTLAINNSKLMVGQGLQCGPFHYLVG